MAFFRTLCIDDLSVALNAGVWLMPSRKAVKLFNSRKFRALDPDNNLVMHEVRWAFASPAAAQRGHLVREAAAKFVQGVFGAMDMEANGHNRVKCGNAVDVCFSYKVGTVVVFTHPGSFPVYHANGAGVVSSSHQELDVTKGVRGVVQGVQQLRGDHGVVVDVPLVRIDSGPNAGQLVLVQNVSIQEKVCLMVGGKREEIRLDV